MPRTNLAPAAITILPPSVADGIAAGEVVDRPAAVVKELVENAIDAGARLVEIRLRDAGQSLIEVVDDGSGMPAADLPLAFLRHATSKIGSLDDLRIVRTLGFRGEALASIAAVAEVEAVSRTGDGGEAYSIVLEGGRRVREGAASGGLGTRVSVRRLFFNTPARLRFLKQPATENAVIVRLVTELALGHPEVMMRLEVDGRRLLETPGTGDLRTTFAAVHDSATAIAMLAIDEPPVDGLISPPALHRGTRDHIVILVNGRRIHHRNLSFAVEQAYRGLRDPTRFPLAVLNLRLDPTELDVNVHPTKREVRFRNESAIFAALERACYHALRQSPLYELEAGAGALPLQLRETGVSTFGGLEAAPEVADRSGAPAEPVLDRLPPLRYVGQVLRGYLVAEGHDLLVLVDQHAAHERVLFDRLLARLEARSGSSQLLLVPQVLEVSPTQLAAFEAEQAWLEGLGFVGEPFGPHAIRLAAAPAELPDRRAAAVLDLLLSDQAGDRTPDRRLRPAAALIACHAAVRFGDTLTPEAAEALLSSLTETREPISCPHGRPTTLLLPDHQLRRLFKRPIP